MGNLNLMRKWACAALAAVLFLVLAPVAGAGTITFLSNLFNEGNDRTSANVLVAPVKGVWAVAPWVSFSNTGLGGWSPSNTTIAGTPTAIFTETVFLPYGDNSGWIEGWADDTMSVIVTNSAHPAGLLLQSANDVPSLNCAGKSIGCREGMSWTGVLDNTILAQGVNTFSFPAYQLWGYEFGVAYRGQIESTDNATVPEPGSAVLFCLGGLGLLCVGSFRRRRR